MRQSASIAIAVFAICLGSQANAANISVGTLHGGVSYNDGPYYITPWGDSYYIECGKPRVPYREDANGPKPNSAFFGPIGYRCIRGTYAVDPFYPPRCRTAFVKTSNGWRRERHCS